MSTSSPTTLPSTIANEIITNLLQTVTNTISISSPSSPQIVDLSIDTPEMTETEDDITPIPPPPPPKPTSPTSTSSVIHVPITITISDSEPDSDPQNFRRPQNPLPPPRIRTAIIDVEADTTPPPPPDPDPSPNPTPNPDIIECKSPTRRPRSRPAPQICSACPAPLPPSPLHLSRCKHRLCPQCALRAIATLHNIPPAPPVATTLLPLPVCPASRCRAPLSPLEADHALAPPLVDSFFDQARSLFHIWRQAVPSDGDNDDPISTPADIDFPQYTSEFTAFILPSGALEGMHLLVQDDFATACEPLWAFDDERCAEDAAWLCTVCGCYDTTRVAAPSSPDLDDVEDDVDVVPAPPMPAYPHCAHARALGVYANVSGLARVWEDDKVAAERKKAEEGRAAKGATPRRRATKRYRSASSIRGAKRRKVSAGRKVGFAKGTGYGGGGGAEWKGASDKLLAETAKLDAEATFWLIRLRCFLLRSGEGGHAAWPGFMRGLLRECRLVSHLAHILINESIMDVLGRIPVFYAALRVVHALSESPSLRPLLTEPSDGDNGRSIAELVESLSRQAAFLTTGAGPEGLPESTSFLIKQIRKCIRVINRHNLLQVVKNRNVCPVEIDDADGNSPIVEELDRSPSNEKELEKPAAGTGDIPEPKPISFEADKALYIEKMRTHQFQAVPGLAASSTFYQEARREEMHGVPQGKRQRRIASEVASLFSSLPLSWSSTILLRVDEDRYDFLRACIFGPEDTPYDSGAFVFDIYLPQTYPDVPPKFRLLTTGGGKVRFNPNLYSNGKVCLSLLGTWSGPSWTSASTILQVLVSIQSLILVPDPYFNEPGFERTLGTESGKRASAHYNARARLDTALYAIRANIRHPTPDLYAGILAHFRLKKRFLIHNLRNWFPKATQRDPDTNRLDNSNGGQGGAHSLALSVDPISGLSNAGQLTGASGSSALPLWSSAVMTTQAFSAMGSGRHFRSPEMTSTNLDGIIDDLESLVQV